MFIVEEFVDSGPLKTDCIEHSARHLGDAGRRIAVHRFRCNAFNHDRSEKRGIEKVFVFASITECSGSGHDRVGKNQRSEFH